MAERDVCQESCLHIIAMSLNVVSRFSNEISVSLIIWVGLGWAINQR